MKKHYSEKLDAFVDCNATVQDCPMTITDKNGNKIKVEHFEGDDKKGQEEYIRKLYEVNNNLAKSTIVDDLINTVEVEKEFAQYRNKVAAALLYTLDTQKKILDDRRELNLRQGVIPPAEVEKEYNEKLAELKTDISLLLNIVESSKDTEDLRDKYLMSCNPAKREDFKGKSVNTVHVDEMSDGTVMFSKPLRNSNYGAAINYHTTDLGAIRHEVAAKKMADALGEEYEKLVPKTFIKVENYEDDTTEEEYYNTGLDKIQRSDICSTSEKMNGLGFDPVEEWWRVHDKDSDSNNSDKEKNNSEMLDVQKGKWGIIEYIEPDEIKKIALYDCIIGSIDRHLGNALYENGNVMLNRPKEKNLPPNARHARVSALIDNGYSFVPADMNGNKRRLGACIFTYDRFKLNDEDKQLLKKVLDSKDLLGVANFLTKEEQDGVRWRCEKMLKLGTTLNTHKKDDITDDDYTDF